MAFLLSELADRFDLQLVGDPATIISGIASLSQATATDISFFSGGARHRAELQQSAAGAVILCDQDRRYHQGNCLVSANPHADYARIAAFIFPRRRQAAGVHETAVVDESAIVEASASIGPNAVIEANVTIAAGCEVGAGCYLGEGARLDSNTKLHANVSVMHGVRIGSDCVLHPGCVIGADGFGHARDQGHWLPVPQLGSVAIGDNVSIGANTTVDRGALGDTVIGNGVKLDNLIHIAHNVEIGDDTAMAACVGIAGSTRIGKRCTFAGQVGVADNLQICDDVHFTGASVVLKDVQRPGVYSSGVLLDDSASWRRNAMRFRQLDWLYRQVKEIKKKLD
jgi:UDP-3-O-[3-hydroxymyristoyl] glucosamine N-acyltransferase